MEKSRFYQVAVSYEAYTRAQSSSPKHTLTPLPYHIREEQDSQGHMADPHHENIFSNN